jgi:hypothetical protein
MQNLSKVITNSKKTTDSGICDLIKMSPNIKTLYVNEIYINNKTIEAFTERANNNHKIQYKFSRYHTISDCYSDNKSHFNICGIFQNLLISGFRP